MASPTKILTNARPVRVAYFVQDDENSEFVLDAIFAASFGFWGGRFSLIVPCDEGKPRPAFIPWLTTFDPDVIYSYVDLENSDVELLHERLYPSFLIRHQTHTEPPHDAHAFRPRLPIDPLHIDTLVPLAAAPYRFTPGQDARLLDVSGRLRSNRFIGDNFGAWTRSSGHSFPSYLNEYGHTLTLIDDQDSQPREQYFTPPEETIGSVNDLLEVMERTRVTTVAGLSTMATPRLEISSRPWSNSFNLVVGDSFTDRLVYWNARFMYPKWRDRDVVDMRLPLKYLDDKDFLELLAKFLRSRNRVTMESGSNVPRTTIRSSSVPTKELDELAEILKGDSGWISYETKAVSAPEDCLPERDVLERSVFRVSDMLIARESSNWKESFALNEEIRPDSPRPEHLRFGPPGIFSPYNGAWATEFEIERKINHSRYSNVKQVWRLPRRLRMTSAFVDGYQITSSFGNFMVPRVSRGGLLTLFANSEAMLPTIRMPTDQAAFFTGLTQGRDWWPFVRSAKDREQGPKQLCQAVSRSENGRYFWGVLQMFGDLNSANGYLLHRFWLDQFEKLGASASRTETRRDYVLSSLKKRFRGQTLDTGDSEDLTKIANIVLKESELFRTHIPSLNWDEISSAHDDLQKAHWEEYPPADDLDVDEWQRHEKACLVEALKKLCSVGVMHQGYEHKCRTCLHRSWISIEKLEGEIVCEVCREAQPAPVDQSWQFRLNDFVREALRKHGILPLFWALSRMQSFETKSFFFEGPVDIYYEQYPEEAKGPDTDIDLVVVANGIVTMCEVKQSAQQLSKADGIIEVAKRLRPDIAVIAVMEKQSKRTDNAFRRLSEGLKGTGVEPRIITLDDEQDLERSPSF